MVEHQDVHKILYICPISILGGAEISLVNLLAKLDRNKFYPVVVCPAGGELPRMLRKTGATVENARFRRFKRNVSVFAIIAHLFAYLFTLARLVRLSRRYDAQILHANNTSAQIYAAPVAFLLRRPSVWTVRDMVPLGFIGKVLYRVSRKIIVPSKAVETDILQCAANPGGGNPGTDGSGTCSERQNGRQFSSLSKVIKIYNGIDIDEWSCSADGHEGRRSCEDVRREFHVDDVAPLIAMVGQMVPWKGGRNFLEAAKSLIATTPTAKFLIIGEDLFGEHTDYRDELIRFCRDANIAGNVIFTGYREDLPRILRAVDLLVLPSTNEPFGRVLIEAMSLEKPVIATNTGGPCEIVVDGVTGILVPAGDPQALAAGMMRFSKDPQLRERMGRAGRRRVEELFDIRDTARNVEELYNKILSK
jgi:glycosyltransferase involved in cell wall biosynthesis